MNEDYTICLTSYPARSKNLPNVIESLYNQTCKPKEIVISIYNGHSEDMAHDLLHVQERYGCRIGLIAQDFKVYKKFLFAMGKVTSPIICVDDDMLYKPHFAERLLEVHSKTGGLVSGNTYWHNGLKCHCGCASLIIPEAFEGWQNYIRHFDEWRSSDMFYTMIAANNHYLYTSAGEVWKEEAISFKEGQGYTRKGMVQETYEQIAKELRWIR